MDVLLGMEARLVCLGTGYPHPDFTWQKDGHTIYLDNFMYKGSGNSRGSGSGSGQHLLSVLEMRTRVLRFTVMNSIMSLPSGMGSAMDTDETYPLTLGDLGAASVFVFGSVQREDTANYTCIAANMLRETRALCDESEIISLVVLGKVISALLCVCTDSMIGLF